VEMHLYYKDLLQPAMVGGRLKFKLPRRLVHFLSDFDPTNPNHNVSIELGSLPLCFPPSSRSQSILTPLFLSSSLPLSLSPSLSSRRHRQRACLEHGPRKGPAPHLVANQVALSPQP
jgi:hypothetical protein